jgi:hypothetical protein
MKDIVTKSNVANYICEFSWRNSLTGGLKTDITYTAVSGYYIRQGGSGVTIPITSTIEANPYNGSATSGAFCETSIKGIYQFHVPNSCCMTGVNNVKILLVSSGVIDKEINLSLIDSDLRDNNRLGLTSLPIYSPGSVSGLTMNPASGNLQVDLRNINGKSIAGTTNQIADSFITQYNIPSPVFTNASVNQKGDSFSRLGVPVSVNISSDITDFKNIVTSGVMIASSGLDNIPITSPEGIASTFREMLVQTWRRFFKKATMTSSELKTYADNDTDVLTTQSLSDNGTTQIQGPSS